MQLSDKNRDADMAFSTVLCSNDSQKHLARILMEVVKKNISKEKLLNELKERVTPHVFASKEVQENYDSYRALRAEIVKKGIDLPGTNVTGPLISRKIIIVIWEGDTRIKCQVSTMKTG